MTKILTSPLSKPEVKQLKVATTFYLSGRLYTGRDMAHQKILKLLKAAAELPFKLKNQAIYHCGPLVRKTPAGWKIVAAGPTTSRRLEPLMSEFFERLTPRLLIGKGGMGETTRQLLLTHGAVYAAYTGGAAVLAARSIKRVENVWWIEELGMAEAVWCFEVERFGPLIVTMDSYGEVLLPGMQE